MVGFLRKAMPGSAPDPKLLFAHFQAVLDGNNRSLEIITDLGEKLGGDYLFDINYTRSTYESLYEAIGGSIRNFSLLSDNRYPQLAEALALINGLVQRMFDGSTLADGPLVVAYPDLTWDMAETVGGKNSNLAEIGNALHLSIPESFAVTTTAFDAFIDHNQLAGPLAALAATPTDEAAADLRAKVLGGTIPPQLADDFERAAAKIRERRGPDATFAIRSSADEEDGDFSFAGQFESVLNVPCNGPAVGEAYKTVLASLFHADAIAYQKHLGLSPGRLKMAVGGVSMVDALCSGVIYTVASGSGPDAILINAAWGLGVAVVDGQTDADLYTVSKGEGPRLLSCRTGAKETMVVSRGNDGTEIVATPAEMRAQNCLSELQVLELARQAMAIETYFKAPQDIEWAIDRKGRCYILQARGLRVDGSGGEHGDDSARGEIAGPCHLPVLLANQGSVVQKGAAAGKVFVLKSADELDQAPRGAILVARHDSPHFVRVIPFLGAIVTDVGAPTSHMASICREFNVPTVVNVGNGTSLLRHGEEVTLFCGDDNQVTVYAGIAHDLLRQQRQSALKVRELYEFRRQKYIMRYIAPLNLVNPLEDDFVPEKCKTVHDLIRFMHEKSVQELVASATRQGRGVIGALGGRKGLRRLALDLPMQLLAIDLGGGIDDNGRGDVAFSGIGSIPLRALISGMLHPGVWHDHAMALQGKDLLSGMARAGDFSGPSTAAGVNLAVISKEYVNMSMRFGYHFNMLDSYCSDTPRNNHIYFRFVGGAASINSRSLRIRMMAKILGAAGFIIKTKGDLLVARLSNLSREDIERILDQIGRLVGFTRQLDAILNTEAAADRLADAFLAGDYSVGSKSE